VADQEQQPTFNVLKTWAFDDWGLYGRGDELLSRALARHTRVGRVFHVQPPVDPREFRTRFRDPRWDQDLESQLGRLDGIEDGGVFLFTPQADPDRPDAALDRTVERLERERAFAAPLVLLQGLAHPFAADLARRLGGRGVTRVALARRDARAAYAPDSDEYKVFDDLYATQVPGADLVWAGTQDLVTEFRARNYHTGANRFRASGY
jgi:hypothetical protein